MKFEGVITALVTPFLEGKVDYPSLQRLIKNQLDAGIDGFVVNGTTAESPTLGIDEVKAIFEFVKSETSSQVPLILGTGSNSTQKTIESTQKAEKWGADAALVVTPYYNKPTQAGLLAHFTAVANETGLPIILYNVPGRTVTSISTEIGLQLAQHANIVGIKEATGDMSVAKQYIEAKSEKFKVLSGDDPTCVEMMELGGDGVISVVSHIIPEQLVQISNEVRKMGKKSNQAYQDLAEELNKQLYAEPNPIGVKMALHLMGILQTPDLRLPMTQATEETKKQLSQVLKQIGAIS